MERRRPVHKEDVGVGVHRTALKSVRHLGSAHEGTDHFISQRATAAANAVLLVILAVVAVGLSGKTYGEAVRFVGSPWVAVPLGLAIVSVCLHMKLGIQVVLEDYIHSDGRRVVLLMLNAFFSLVVAAVALYALLRIVFAAMTLPA